MGLASRSYMTDGQGTRPARHVVFWIIGLTVAMYFLQGMLQGRGGVDLTRILGVVPDRLVGRGWLWQLVTHAFLHDFRSVWHLAFNMLALWWLGTDVADLYGVRRFLLLYFGGAAMCAAVYCAVAYVDGRPHVPAVGASGAVLAVSVVAAFLFPTRTILLFWFLPTPLWLVVLLYVGSDAYYVATGIQTGTASAGHLGGALFGFLVHKLNLDGSWMERLWLRIRSRVPRERHEPRPSDPEVDRILDKIHTQGIGSLTEGERETLKRAGGR